eukprot:scaffold31364_cov78-Phaeocystis_antarctica.AAC.3
MNERISASSYARCPAPPPSAAPETPAAVVRRAPPPPSRTCAPPSRQAAGPARACTHALPGYSIREHLDPRAVPRLDLPFEPKPHSIQFTLVDHTTPRHESDEDGARC